MTNKNRFTRLLLQFFTLRVVYDPSKDRIRICTQIYNITLHSIITFYFIYVIQGMVSGFSKLKPILFTCIVNIIISFLYFPISCDKSIRNKILAMLNLFDYILTLFFISNYGLRLYLPSNLYIATSMPIVIVLHSFFIENMIISTVMILLVIVEESLRVYRYETTYELFPSIFMTIVCYIAICFVCFFILLDRSSISYLKAQSDTSNQILFQSMEACPIGFSIFKNHQNTFTNEECIKLFNIRSNNEVQATIDSLPLHSKIINDNEKKDASHMLIEYKEKTIDWKIKQFTINNESISIHTFADMSNHKALKLAEMNRKSVEMLVATSTHELRSPLNGIKSALTYLKMQHIEKENEVVIDRAIGACEYQESLINDIMDFAKIQGGKMKINNATFDLVTTLQSCYDIMELQAKDKGLSFSFSCKQPQELSILIDSDQRRIKQVVLNLLSNSLKFTMKGFIKLSLNITKNQHIFISVKDSGIGINPTSLPYLFKEFGTLAESESENTTGTGLGLHLCKKLVAMLGGSITVKSKYGEGSKFTVSLPYETKNPLETEKSECQINGYIATTESDDYTKGKTILLVDDSPMNTIVLSKMLKSLGYSCISAYNGADALNIISNRIDAIRIAFIDLHMPQMDGYELADKICSLYKTKNEIRFPLIALTGDEIADVQIPCLNHGFTDVLVKPISLALIEGILRKY